jgi:hypothetical protein
MNWLNHVERDPVPWLLDPSHPSARLLTLRDILRWPEDALVEEGQALLEWKPIQALLERADSLSFWGRTTNPYFGGPIGTLGTLYALAQAGVPPTEMIRRACEHLMSRGRLEDGRFAPPGAGPREWLYYTGIALSSLWHFGFGGDARVGSARSALVQEILHRPRLLESTSVDEDECLWGAVKALEALTPSFDEGDDGLRAARERLTEYLLDFTFDFNGRHAEWQEVTYPRYYRSDLVELCRVLSRAAASDSRMQSLVRWLLRLPREGGRWVKTRPTPGSLQVERLRHPSRWLTYESVLALILVYGDETYRA